jgi:hypothetical protein
MKFWPEDEETPSGKLAGLDVAEIAALLPDVAPEGDAYDILRDVLTTLSEQSRERRGLIH